MEESFSLLVKMAADDVYEFIDWRAIVVRPHTSFVQLLRMKCDPHFMQTRMYHNLFHVAEYSQLHRLSHDS